jgi:hypothetical protein
VLVRLCTATARSLRSLLVAPLASPATVTALLPRCTPPSPPSLLLLSLRSCGSASAQNPNLTLLLLNVESRRPGEAAERLEPSRVLNRTGEARGAEFDSVQPSVRGATIRASPGPVITLVAAGEGLLSALYCFCALANAALSPVSLPVTFTTAGRGI